MSVYTSEYPLDLAAFESWQREQYTAEEDEAERFSRLVRKVIENELDDSEKELIRLYYYERLTVTKIAGIEGVNHSTISRRLNKIHGKLYTYLKYAAELHFGRGM